MGVLERNHWLPRKYQPWTKRAVTAFFQDINANKVEIKGRRLKAIRCKRSKREHHERNGQTEDPLHKNRGILAGRQQNPTKKPS